MASKLIFALCFLVAAASALPEPGGAWIRAWGGPGINPWIPPWVAAAPWFPQWAACTTTGSACVDCHTKVVCTKFGNLQQACTNPSFPYCNLGVCSATPTAECAPVSAVPLQTAT